MVNKISFSNINCNLREKRRRRGRRRRRRREKGKEGGEVRTVGEQGERGSKDEGSTIKQLKQRLVQVWSTLVVQVL